MNCDPKALIEAAKCFRCIPHSRVNNIAIYLLCQWANNPTGPQVFWEPESAVSSWTDGSGIHVGDLPTFLASANLPTVGSIQLIGVGLTAIGNLNLLPNLTNLEVNGNAGLTDLDLTGCAALSTVFCQNCGLTSLTLDGCITVTTLNCSNNQIASLDVSVCTVMDNLNCSNNLIASLDCTGLALMTVLNCSSNPNLTTLNVTGCTSLSSVNMSSAAVSPTITGIASCQGSLTALNASINQLISLDLTGFSILAAFTANDNPNLQTLILSGCSSLVGVFPFDGPSGFVSLATLDISGCTGMTGLGCDQDTLLSSLNVSGCINLTSIDCHSDSLIVIDLSNLTSLTQIICHSQLTLTTLILTNCSSLTSIEGSNCLLTGVDIGDCPLLNNVLLSSNALTSHDVNVILDDLVGFGPIAAGYIELNSQTPAAPPTSPPDPASPPDGIVQKAALEGVWGVGNVNTD